MSSVLLTVFHVALFFSSFATSTPVFDKTASGNFFDAKPSKLGQLQDKEAIPDYSDCSQSHWCQGYLYGAPTKETLGGVNVYEAHKISNNMGEDGRGILAELGRHWDRHFDLPEPEWRNGDESRPHNHTTSSAGVIWGQANGIGITGIAAKARAASVYHLGFSNGLFPYLEAGDVMMFVYAWRVEYKSAKCHNPAILMYQYRHDFVRFLTQQKGVHVVQAGGNRECNMDHPDLGHLFRRDYADTGAVIVGAIDPTRGGVREYDSAYGSLVDVSSWGSKVTTVFAGGNFWYEYAGTSSASVIVAGVILHLQSVARARGIGNVPPLKMRQIVIETGNYPLTGDDRSVVGPQPDLVKALGLLDPSLGPPVKRRYSILYNRETTGRRRRQQRTSAK